MIFSTNQCLFVLLLPSEVYGGDTNSLNNSHKCESECDADSVIGGTSDVASSIAGIPPADRNEAPLKLAEPHWKAVPIDEELMDSLKRKDIDTTRKCLKRMKHDINNQNEKGVTALMIVSLKPGYDAFVAEFLSHENIDVNLRNSKGSTALYLASQAGNDMVVYSLIYHDGININAENKLGNTPLYIAAQKGYDNIVEALLGKEEIDVNHINNKNGTALQIASKNGNGTIVEKLLTHANMTTVNHPEKTASEINTQQDPNYSLSALYNACESNHQDVVDKLLQYHAIDVNQQESFYGYTPLMVASEKGYENIVNLLLNHPRIELNKGRDDGATALYVAAQNGHSRVVQRLLEQKNIEVNKSNEDDFTPLRMAAQNNHFQIVEQLLGHDKIDQTCVDKYGNTPAQIAQDYGHSEITEIIRQSQFVEYSKYRTQALRSDHQIVDIVESQAEVGDEVELCNLEPRELNRLTGTIHCECPSSSEWWILRMHFVQLDYLSTTSRRQFSQHNGGFVGRFKKRNVRVIKSLGLSSSKIAMSIPERSLASLPDPFVVDVRRKASGCHRTLEDDDLGVLFKVSNTRFENVSIICESL